jgi:hypothetical protein
MSNAACQLWPSHGGRGIRQLGCKPDCSAAAASSGTVCASCSHSVNIAIQCNSSTQGPSRWQKMFLVSFAIQALSINLPCCAVLCCDAQGDVHKRKEIVQDVTLHDLDSANARPAGGQDIMRCVVVVVRGGGGGRAAL